MNVSLHTEFQTNTPIGFYLQFTRRVTIVRGLVRVLEVRVGREGYQNGQSHLLLEEGQCPVFRHECGV